MNNRQVGAWIEVLHESLAEVREQLPALRSELAGQDGMGGLLRGFGRILLVGILLIPLAVLLGLVALILLLFPSARERFVFGLQLGGHVLVGVTVGVVAVGLLRLISRSETAYPRLVQFVDDHPRLADSRYQLAALALVEAYLASRTDYGLATTGLLVLVTTAAVVWIAGRLDLEHLFRPLDPWMILGLERTADDNEIKKAYRRLALELHPDRNPDGEEEMKAVNDAYDRISTAEKRALWLEINEGAFRTA